MVIEGPIITELVTVISVLVTMVFTIITMAFTTITMALDIAIISITLDPCSDLVSLAQEGVVVTSEWGLVSC